MQWNFRFSFSHHSSHLQVVHRFIDASCLRWRHHRVRRELMPYFWGLAVKCLLRTVRSKKRLFNWFVCLIFYKLDFKTFLFVNLRLVDFFDHVWIPILSFEPSLFFFKFLGFFLSLDCSFLGSLLLKVCFELRLVRILQVWFRSLILCFLPKPFLLSLMRLISFRVILQVFMF